MFCNSGFIKRHTATDIAFEVLIYSRLLASGFRSKSFLNHECLERKSAGTEELKLRFVRPDRATVCICNLLKLAGYAELA